MGPNPEAQKAPTEKPNREKNSSSLRLWHTEWKQTLHQASLSETRQKRMQERVVVSLTLPMGNANTDYVIPRAKCNFLTEPEVKAALPDYHSQDSF